MSSCTIPQGRLTIALLQQPPYKATLAFFNQIWHNARLNSRITVSMDSIITALPLGEDASIIKLVNTIFLKAVQKEASDIHFEPYENQYRIRYRQDGLLIEITSLPVNLANRIAARIKIMSNLDISERRLPQDGRFKLQITQTESIDFRVNTCPTLDGEKIVTRIIKPHSTQLTIENIGFNALQQKLFLAALEKPQGMILVTGPTGSGKTVTLYSALTLLNTQEKNIMTIEDPVEVKIAGINQVNVNTKIDMNFSNALRSFLRQDPDVIMVGEIRDLETADIAIKAAQTGHLVLSTLHTNSAAETLTRLISMGIPSFNIVNTLRLVIAQRLVRRLCEQCKMLDQEISLSDLIALGFTPGDKLYKAQGCTQCTNGYRGRIGLFEVMPLSASLNQLLMANKHAVTISQQAQTEGMLTMYQTGLEKAKMGLTTLEEIYRVTIP